MTSKTSAQPTPKAQPKGDAPKNDVNPGDPGPAVMKPGADVPFDKKRVPDAEHAGSPKVAKP